LFAASVRADLNASLKGAGWSGAVVWLRGQHLAARGGGFFWPHEGSALWGGFVGLRWLPWEGTVRPFVEAEALLYGRAGPHPGGRGAIGLDVTVLRHLEIGAGFGFYFVSQNTRTPLSETTFWSPFVELSLF